jgi:hypothetical protein
VSCAVQAVPTVRGQRPAVSALGKTLRAKTRRTTSQSGRGGAFGSERFFGSGSDALDVPSELTEFRGLLLAPKSQGKGGDDGLLMAGGPECACRTVEQDDVQLSAIVVRPRDPGSLPCGTPALFPPRSPNETARGVSGRLGSPVSVILGHHFPTHRRPVVPLPSRY